MTSKAESAGCCVVKVSPRKLRPSQHDPETGTYRKKALWERSHQLGDTDWYMDRDVAAAMNLYFADPATHSYDLTVPLAKVSPSSNLAMWGSRSSPRVYKMAR